ncbi:hypothetical protein [Nostoc sp. MG11]|uniref:hypothetical protein n=1 Tax=Nostoc sp. MG11 TaxID=2721166 RepID=UPI001D02BFDF|nr:hypothetical protein [Nostoc sp. MG11]
MSTEGKFSAQDSALRTKSFKFDKFRMYGVTQKRLMTLTLNLSPELEQYLAQKAREQGLSVEAYTLQIITNHILLKEKQSKLVNLLQSWIDEDDAKEQQETGEYLIHALDEDRLSDRKLFPLELKGVTW